MALGKIQSKVKSFFHSNLHKRRRPSSISSECENKKPKNESTLTVYNDDGGSGFNQQLTSSFFRDLPIEIRKMIYGLVWLGQWDHKYHSRGRHLHFQNGHWTNTRCVMYEDDENLDLIQRNSTLVSYSFLVSYTSLGNKRVLIQNVKDYMPIIS